MIGAHDAEVAFVERRDLLETETLGENHHGRIGAAETKIGVVLNKHPDTLPFSDRERLDHELARNDVFVQRYLTRRANLASNQVRRFCDDEGGGDQRTSGGLEQLAASNVVGIFDVGSRDERAGVDNQHRSVTPESLSQHLVCVTGALGAIRGAYARDRQMATHISTAGKMFLNRFRDDGIECHAATIRFGLQCFQHLAWQINGHGHGGKFTA